MTIGSIIVSKTVNRSAHAKREQKGVDWAGESVNGLIQRESKVFKSGVYRYPFFESIFHVYHHPSLACLNFYNPPISFSRSAAARQVFRIRHRVVFPVWREQIFWSCKPTQRKSSNIGFAPELGSFAWEFLKTFSGYPQIIHFDAIFPYTPSILGIPHDYGNHHLCNLMNPKPDDILLFTSRWWLFNWMFIPTCQCSHNPQSPTIGKCSFQYNAPVHGWGQ